MKLFSSSKKEPEKERTQSNLSGNEKESLFSFFIHDLTGPLSIINTSTQHLLHKGERYGPLTNDQKVIVERILRNASKAQTLLQEVIELFRSEGRFFEKELFWVENALKDAIIDVFEVINPSLAETFYKTQNRKEFQQVLETQGISMEITGKYGASQFCHDPKKIRQILRNLISNAQKYRRSKTRISIEGESDLLISVEDDGNGISQEEQEMIFKRFVRRNGDKLSNVPGIGLGLHGVKTLVEAMKGEIRLESQMGVGTRFILQIPPLQ